MSEVEETEQGKRDKSELKEVERQADLAGDRFVTDF
jgi:hypothetical protein